jgi:hypothetical protein
MSYPYLLGVIKQDKYIDRKEQVVFQPDRKQMIDEFIYKNFGFKLSTLMFSAGSSDSDLSELYVKHDKNGYHYASIQEGEKSDYHYISTLIDYDNLDGFNFEFYARDLIKPLYKGSKLDRGMCV